MCYLGGSLIDRFALRVPCDKPFLKLLVRFLGCMFGGHLVYQ